MSEEKKAEIIDFIKKAGPKKKETSAPIHIVTNGNNNIVTGGSINGNININVKKIEKTEFTPGPNHIPSNVAKKIQDLVAKIAAKEEAGGMETKRAFAKWYKKIKDRYDVNTYLAIPEHLGAEAITWLQQQSRIKNSKIRKNDPAMWRKTQYASINAMARDLGLSKGEVYNLALTRLEKRVSSLTQLSDQNLEKLYIIIQSMK